MSLRNQYDVAPNTIPNRTEKTKKIKLSSTAFKKNNIKQKKTMENFTKYENPGNLDQISF